MKQSPILILLVGIVLGLIINPTLCIQFSLVSNDACLWWNYLDVEQQ